MSLDIVSWPLSNQNAGKNAPLESLKTNEKPHKQKKFVRLQIKDAPPLKVSNKNATSTVPTIKERKPAVVPILDFLKVGDMHLEIIHRQKSNLVNIDNILRQSREVHPARIYEVDLHNNSISKIERLDKFSNCRSLDLSCNTISYIENLDGLQDLRELKLYGNCISEIKNLQCLEDLVSLSLQHNSITAVGDAFSLLKNLKTLRLDSNRIDYIHPSAFSNLSQLVTLDISYNPLDNLSAVKYANHLEELKCAGNKLKKVDVGGCFNLRELDMSQNMISNVSALQNLKKLEVLNISQNQLTSKAISEVGTLKSLVELDVSYNRLKLLSSFKSQFPSLECINASNNRVSNMSEIKSLFTLKHLSELNVGGNPFSKDIPDYHEDLLSHLPNLQILNEAQTPRVSLSPQAKTSVMRPMSVQTLMNSRHVETQLTSIDDGLADSCKSINETFRSLQDIIYQLKTWRGDDPKLLDRLTPPSLAPSLLPATPLEVSISPTPIIPSTEVKQKPRLAHLEGQFGMDTGDTHSSDEGLMIQSSRVFQSRLPLMTTGPTCTAEDDLKIFDDDGLSTVYNSRASSAGTSGGSRPVSG